MSDYIVVTVLGSIHNSCTCAGSSSTQTHNPPYLVQPATLILGDADIVFRRADKCSPIYDMWLWPNEWAGTRTIIVGELRRTAIEDRHIDLPSNSKNTREERHWGYCQSKLGRVQVRIIVLFFLFYTCIIYFNRDFTCPFTTCTFWGIQWINFEQM